MLTKLLGLFVCLLFTSCASYLTRQQCDQINWYQHGQDIAMRGDRISNDEMVNSCRKADAEIAESKLDQGFKAGMAQYCEPDTAFITGKNGESLNLDLCDPGRYGNIKKRHAEGVNAYCKDGLTAGLSGKKYKNICPADLEKNFIPSYRQGRKKYLSALLQNNESKIRELNLEIDRLTYEKRINDGRTSSLPFVKTGEQDSYASERQRLSNQSWQLSSQLNQKKSNKNQIENENDNFRKELATLNY